MYNGEHYRDPTAGNALKNINRDPNEERAKVTIRGMRMVAQRQGFALVGRIKIKDVKTGKVYK